MANRNLNRPFCYQKMLTLLTGKVYLSAAGAVLSQGGIGFSCAKTGTGAYRFTLDDQFNDVQGIDVSLIEVTPTALTIKAKNNYTTIMTQKAGTFEVVILSGATPTDVSALSEIHFQLNLKNTSVPL